MRIAEDIPASDHVGTMQQLHALGPEDAHLTRDPEISHWRPNPIETHQPFAIECVPETVRHAWGTVTRVPISRVGSYLGNVMVHVEIDAPGMDALVTAHPYGAVYLMERVSLVVRGRVIDALTPDAIVTKHSFHTSAAHRSGLDEMMRGVRLSDTRRRAYIPLPFWFSGPYTRETPRFPLYPLFNDKLADLAIEIRWAPHPSLSVGEVLGVPHGYPVDAEIVAELMIDHAVVDVSETRVLQDSLGREQLIEVHETFTTRVQGRTCKLELPFSSNVKQMFWGFRADDVASSWSFSGNEHLIRSDLRIESTSVAPEAPKDPMWHRVVEPIARGQTPAGNGIFSRSFALYPRLFNPSGSFRTSRTNNFLVLEFDAPVDGEVVIMAIAYNVLRYERGAYALVFGA